MTSLEQPLFQLSRQLPDIRQGAVPAVPLPSRGHEVIWWKSRGSMNKFYFRVFDLNISCKSVSFQLFFECDWIRQVCQLFAGIGTNRSRARGCSSQRWPGTPAWHEKQTCERIAHPRSVRFVHVVSGGRYFEWYLCSWEVPGLIWDRVGGFVAGYTGVAGYPLEGDISVGCKEGREMGPCVCAPAPERVWLHKQFRLIHVPLVLWQKYMSRL